MAHSLALITGASSGIGKSFAQALAREGYDLVLAARREDKLKALAEHLTSTHGVDVQVFGVDLSSSLGVENLEQRFDALGRPLELLVNNAGFGSYGAFAELDLGTELQMLDLNVRAVVQLTGWALPKMLARRSGAIVQIASTTSFQPVPYMATYGASKAAVLSFSEAVAREVHDSGVRVLAVCPGHTPTEFQARSGVNNRPVRTASQEADDVVREALEALRHGAHVVVTGLPNKLTTQAPRLLPRRLLSWVVARGFRPRRA